MCKRMKERKVARYWGQDEEMEGRVKLANKKENELDRNLFA